MSKVNEITETQLNAIEMFVNQECKSFSQSISSIRHSKASGTGEAIPPGRPISEIFVVAIPKEDGQGILKALNEFNANGNADVKFNGITIHRIIGFWRGFVETL